MRLKWLWLFFGLTGPTNQNRPIANHFNFYVFSTILMKFGMWTANAPALLLLLPCSCIAPGLLLASSQPVPGLLMVTSCPAPDPSHPSFAAFIIISTLRLFLARREPPFMVISENATIAIYCHRVKTFFERKIWYWFLVFYKNEAGMSPPSKIGTIS